LLSLKKAYPKPASGAVSPRKGGRRQCVAAETLGDVLRRIGRLAGLQGVLSLTDAQLLERFAVGRDEPAFAALMVRHGPMVLGVCRRLLHDADQAEDAFQAAFLVLARKAGSIQRQPLLSAWLYGVAYKVAARLRGRTWKRRARETSGVDLASVAATIDPDPSDLPPLLHQEVQRLPDKYRNPIVLCYLEGKTHEEAALLLHWPLGTVKGRLARARDLLRSQLTRRGVTASEGMMATALAAKSATAPAKLMDATIRAATRFAAGEGGAGKLASARAIALSQGVLRTMILTKLKIVGALVLTATIVGGGAGWSAFRAPAAESARETQTNKDDKFKDDKDAIQGVWQVTRTEWGGKEVHTTEAQLGLLPAKWTIGADKITVEIPKLGSFGGVSYKIDPTKTPKQIDFPSFNWLPTEVGKTNRKIYSLEGDVLKICMPSEPDANERPTKLATEIGSQTTLITLKRMTLDQNNQKEDGAKVKKLLQDWCDTARLEYQARKQELEAGKIVVGPVADSSRRLLKAELERADKKEDRTAAYEAYYQRAAEATMTVKLKWTAGKSATADVAQAESYRLEAEVMLEREKAK